jgi:hypothetical protein
MIFNPLHKIEIDQIVKQLILVYKEKETIYISSAITTGKIFMDWIKTSGSQIKNKEEYKFQHYEKVIVPNSETILNFTQKLRSKLKDPVVEPASLIMQDWSQDDYLYYWGEFISKYVKQIIFLDGWPYSKGCTYEYYLGLINNLDLLDQRLNKIDKPKAITLIKSALQEYDDNQIIVPCIQQELLIEIEKYIC